MERYTTSSRLPAMLLAMLLLLASELATLSCGHRTPRAEVAAWSRRHGRAAAPTTTTTTTTVVARAAPPAAAEDAEAAAVLGESKRLVPQGSNPLHN
ncbi:hypothetical protein PR202_gb14888 [Eleusine coracana subsp. coracana]|uniref:Uncharacterized protein n=1 Tax=Eleusine coracana subsp. coracana TaxID=191504 RepID=A0AAV5EWB3_ELECO|nr:hypothetical protein QOZ80_4BG0340570 [Eleusine coracana subsp. coracana]GJN26921.1 hypothetical protein PR202_gb14888 [Eleusine coracana subsp. coracana]